MKQCSQLLRGPAFRWQSRTALLTRAFSSSSNSSFFQTLATPAKAGAFTTASGLTAVLAGYLGTAFLFDDQPAVCEANDDAATAETTPVAESAADPEKTAVNITRDTEVRYLGFTGRAARVLAFAANKVRYLGYSSDIGESARPLLNPKYVKLFYGVTWTYVFADVGYQGYCEQQKGSDNSIVGRTMLQTLTFQSIASVALPTLVIHTAVHQAQKVFANSPPAVKRFGPVIVGLSIIPVLPYVDEPAEELIHLGFNKLWPLPGGEEHAH